MENSRVMSRVGNFWFSLSITKLIFNLVDHLNCFLYFKINSGYNNVCSLSSVGKTKDLNSKITDSKHYRMKISRT